MPGLAPAGFLMLRTSVVSTGTLAPPPTLECSTASSAASCRVASGTVSPRLMTTQWLPGAFCTWNHRSLPRAVCSVSLSFWVLLRPTRISNPSLER